MNADGFAPTTAPIAAKSADDARYASQSHSICLDDSSVGRSCIDQRDSEEARMTYLAGAQQAVEDFHRATGAGLPDTDTIEIRNHELRARLIAEEAMETIAALGFDCLVQVNVGYEDPTDQGRSIFDAVKMGNEDIVELADGIADTIYVLLGTAVEAGLDMEPIFAEVQRSNMSKIDGPIREDGKRLKGPKFSPPNIDAILRTLGWNGD